MFFTFIKSKRRANIGVSRPSVQEKANILNNQVPSIPCEPVLRMPCIRVTANGVKKLLSKIDPNKITGPDGIPGRFLKEVADEIAPALTFICTRFYITSAIGIPA